METKNKHYPEKFKKKIVELYENGKSVIDLAREYGLVRTEADVQNEVRAVATILPDFLH